MCTHISANNFETTSILEAKLFFHWFLGFIAKSKRIPKLQFYGFSQFLNLAKYTYFFELVLDGLSDFHQNWLRSYLDNAGKSYQKISDGSNYSRKAH